MSLIYLNEEIFFLILCLFFFSLTNIYGNGFEFFIQKNGNFVVGVSIKKEFLTASVTSPYLLDGK